MDEYMKELLNQFRLARGINPHGFDPKTYESEFLEWLSNYTKMGEYYFRWIKENGVLKELSPEVAEIGKGRYDTVTLNQPTTLISPYIGHLDVPNTIFNYDFTVFNGMPLYRGRKPHDLVEDVDIFMTQNPYCMAIMLNWPQLYNYNDFDIIIGLYGNTFDKDREDKLRHLKIWREILRDEFEIKEVTDGDQYCYVLSTNYTKYNKKYHG